MWDDNQYIVLTGTLDWTEERKMDRTKKLGADILLRLGREVCGENTDGIDPTDMIISRLDIMRDEKKIQAYLRFSNAHY